MVYSFRHNIGPLSEISSVYALDMPGYGFTSIVDHALPMGLDTMKIPANRKAQTLLARNLSWGLIERRLENLNHRVLLIWGEQDLYLDVGLSSRFKEKIKNITVEIIKDCGHSAHEEAPEKVNRFIIEFL